MSPEYLQDYEKERRAMANLEGIVRQLVSLLRYFAAPFVAAIIAWMFDEKHDVFNAVLVQN
ncbi:MAG: hypothetical protein A2Y76_12055 [Planctomycetes bacterium RBG_13_60_9]|nr:MAG: hypothetical protein A2Y76_12055 [Planctomycetes bacterium RBG_13_60_9]